MATTNENDPMLRKAIILLHSPDPNSATELRMMIDELIKQRFGPSKMLVNTLSKEQLEMEKNFPGMQTTPEPSVADEVINLTNSPAKTISDSPDTIVDSDEGGGVVAGATTGGGEDADGDVAMLALPTSEEVENLKEFGDLNCCVCGEMMFTANNRLIECSQCGALYHQECHKPAITNEETAEDQVHNWQCNSCNDKPSTSKAAVAALAAATALEEPIPLIAKTKSASASSSRSSSSSNSSSPFYKQEHSSSSSSKHHKSSSSSSKSTKEERAATASSSSSLAKSSVTAAPAVNVISVPEKSSSSSSSKKASHTGSSSKSSSSKSSSSKHHESKRKISK